MLLELAMIYMLVVYTMILALPTIITTTLPIVLRWRWKNDRGRIVAVIVLGWMVYYPWIALVARARVEEAVNVRATIFLLLACAVTATLTHLALYVRDRMKAGESFAQIFYARALELDHISGPSNPNNL